MISIKPILLVGGTLSAEMVRYVVSQIVVEFFNKVALVTMPLVSMPYVFICVCVNVWGSVAVFKGIIPQPHNIEDTSSPMSATIPELLLFPKPVILIGVFCENV